MPSARAVARLVRAGAADDAARILVDQAVTDHGLRRRGPRPGYVPVWLVAELAEVVARLAAGEDLDEMEAEAGDW